MGYYPPHILVSEALRRGVPVVLHLGGVAYADPAGVERRRHELCVLVDVEHVGGHDA